MFHVLLVLPALVTFGAMAAVVLCAPFCAGIVLQLLLTVFGQKKWVLYVPAGLGALGLAGSLLWLLGDVPFTVLLVYWGIYFLALWITWLVVTQIKQAAAKWLGKGKDHE